MSKYKTITVKAPANMPAGQQFVEMQFPTLNKLLDEGWGIKEVHQATTSLNLAFVFLTFVLVKG